MGPAELFQAVQSQAPEENWKEESRYSNQESPVLRQCRIGRFRFQLFSGWRWPAEDQSSRIWAVLAAFYTAVYAGFNLDSTPFEYQFMKVE